MLPQISRSSASAAERPVLAPAWTIALLAGLVGGSLALIYPRQDLERRLATSVDSTDVALSVAYLRNLLNSDPTNASLRLLLAHQQVLLGELPEARATLFPLEQVEDPQVQRDLLWAEWEINHARYLRTPEDQTELRAQQLQELRQQLRVLAQQSWTGQRQIQLGQWAAQFADRATSAQTQRELAEQQTDPERAAQLYEQAAREALGMGDYDTCAQLYLRARATTTDAARAKAYFHAALDTLQAANRPADALALGEREIGVLIDDPATLLRMVELARAAARPDVADKYMRKRLRIALLEATTPIAATAAMAPAVYDDGAQWLQPPRAFASTTWQARTVRLEATQTTPAATTATTAPALAFDDKVYRLAYDVFLENRKPDDAWALARVAVQQRPDDVAWRERLAKVSEWTQKPDVALEQWLWLARKTGRSDAWQAVLRIAPGQFDDRTLIEALQHTLQGRTPDAALLQELIEAYERLGEPQAAMAYLQRHAQRPETAEQMALLAERMGQPAQALAHWRTVLAHPQAVTPERAMHAAVLALTLRQPQQSLQWMEAASTQSVPDTMALDFWRMTGQLAQGQQRQALAIQAYQRIATLREAEHDDLETLARLLKDEHPLESARVSEMAWQQFGQTGDLVEALTYHVSRSRWPDAQRLLQSAHAADGTVAPALQQAPEFLRLAGTIYQNKGQQALARRYFEAGLRLATASIDMRSALLWLFIDSNDATALRQWLATHEATWSQDEPLHDSLAAAYQALSLPQTALTRYLTPRLSAHAHDFLWLMNYADALDQNQQSDQAWRLRQHALRQQRQALREGSKASSGGPALTAQQWLQGQDMDATRRIARARLLLTQNPGDPAYHVLHELLRLDHDAQGQLSNAAAEVAIGWLQDAGEYNAERGFLWQQYARSQGLRANRPLWADITVALAEGDTAATGQLLDTFDERLPRYDRVNAARAVEDMRLAQTAAFEGSDHQNDDQPLHQQLTESLLAFSDSAHVQVQSRKLSGMNEQELNDSVHLALSPRWSLDAGHARILRQSTNVRSVNTPPQETAQQLRLTWKRSDAQTRWTVSQRKSLDTYHPLEVEHEQQLDRRLSLQLSAGTQLPSQESLALRISGMKDKASMALRYQPTRQDTLTATWWAERYQLQTGASVGSGQHQSLYYTHHYRQDSPQLDFSVFANNLRFHRSELRESSDRDRRYRRYLPTNADNPGADYFLPDSFQFYGVQLSTNMIHAQDYTRKVQPFAAISRTWHSRYGGGYSASIGVAGSVLGADHLSIRWSYDRAGLRSEGPTRELQLAYRIHF